MKVLRLENKDGLGIYRCDSNYEIANSFPESPCRPLPRDDHDLVDSFSRFNIDISQSHNKDFLYCFDSPCQLLNWFEEKHEQLIEICEKLNLFVSYYETPVIISGYSHCAIPANEKTLIKRQTIREFLSENTCNCYLK